MQHRDPYAAVALLIAASLMAGNALAARMQIINLDSPGEGLNDPRSATSTGGNTGTTLGEQRRITL